MYVDKDVQDEQHALRLVEVQVLVVDKNERHNACIKGRFQGAKERQLIQVPQSIFDAEKTASTIAVGYIAVVIPIRTCGLGLLAAASATHHHV